ncbi:mechanosensitive ion channel domain-containing protein [Spongorhabdus nitratireducens]
MVIKTGYTLILAFFISSLSLFTSASTNPVQDSTNLPSINVIRDAVASQEQNNQDESSQRLTDIYQRTLTLLQQIQDEQSRLTQQQAELEQAPEKLQVLQQQLAKERVPNQSRLQHQYRHLEEQSLKKQLDQQQVSLVEWQNQLTHTRNRLTAVQARPETARTELTRNQEREKELSDQLTQLLSSEDSLREPRKDMLNSRLYLIQKQNSRLNFEISASTPLTELLQVQGELLQQRIDIANLHIEVLQTLLNEKRREASEEAVADAASMIEEQENVPAMLQHEAARNVQLSEMLLRYADQMAELNHESHDVSEQLQVVTDIRQSLDQQVVILGNNMALARILREQQKALPQVTINLNLNERISQYRLQQFRLSQELRQLNRLNISSKEALARYPGAKSLLSHQQQELGKLLESRRELLDSLTTELNSLLSQALTLQVRQRQLTLTSASLAKTLEEQLFWVASTPPVTLSWVQTLPADVLHQLRRWPVDSLWTSSALYIGQYWQALGALILAAVMITIRRRWLLLKERSLVLKIGNVRSDSLLMTPLALFLALVRQLPVPLLVFGVGLSLNTAGIEHPAYMMAGTALQYLAMCWLFMNMAVHITQSHGIATSHFSWPPAQNRRLHRQLKQMKLIILPMVLIISLSGLNFSDLARDRAGVIIMVTCLALQSLVLSRMLNTSHYLLGSRLAHLIISMLLVALPLSLIVMTVTGYYYTALQLEEKLVLTLMLIASSFLLQAIVIRSLQVAARRLAFARALSKRAAQKEDKDDSDNYEEPALDIQTINQHSLRLINTGLFIGFCIALYWVWQDVFSLFSYLENFRLWESSANSQGQLIPVTLNDLLIAILIFIASLVLARNLPGFLEVLLLSRLQLRPGSSYATTTLLSYVITGLGFSFALSTMGVSWDKVQWLIAALGVGLGFGLQEIFANFVSGLIILFERPVRIGDTVTISDLSGVVSRIRMRATTITDWDHKEIIIPNKMFITEKLINWSLSDSVIRTVVTVGVEHDSDLERVKRCMLQAASENSQVLKEPHASVMLVGQDENALHHELRVHVGTVEERIAVSDSLLRRIHELFQEEGIRLARNKLDIRQED